MGSVLRKQALSPPMAKNTKIANQLLIHVLDTFRSHFGAQASNRKANRASNRRSHAATAAGRPEHLNWGGQIIIFSNENHLFEKSTISDRYLNYKSSTFGAQKRPQKAGGKITTATGARTRIATVQKEARRQQLQLYSFSGPMLADKMRIDIVKLTTSPTF